MVMSGRGDDGGLIDLVKEEDDLEVREGLESRERLDGELGHELDGAPDRTPVVVRGIRATTVHHCNRC